MYTDDTVCTAGVADIILKRQRTRLHPSARVPAPPRPSPRGYFRKWIASAAPTP